MCPSTRPSMELKPDVPVLASGSCAMPMHSGASWSMSE
eukprot:CAMPEP_0196741068 /NCGR_PEP_ID=MMETSP1091-20130531/37605_1 /TAXON_ID=302021 /ORGANISM="Rhodomonas sp., Strain CCMP768" /LENGTH=37 /DNA_ID= /DNA_START= /DNA_END= /DNA_ORIENTATION=